MENFKKQSLEIIELKIDCQYSDPDEKALKIDSKCIIFVKPESEHSNSVYECKPEERSYCFHYIFEKKQLQANFDYKHMKVENDLVSFNRTIKYEKNIKKSILIQFSLKSVLEKYKKLFEYIPKENSPIKKNPKNNSSSDDEPTSNIRLPIRPNPPKKVSSSDSEEEEESNAPKPIAINRKSNKQ